MGISWLLQHYLNPSAARTKCPTITHKQNRQEWERKHIIVGLCACKVNTATKRKEKTHTHVVELSVLQACCLQTEVTSAHWCFTSLRGVRKKNHNSRSSRHFFCFKTRPQNWNKWPQVPDVPFFEGNNIPGLNSCVQMCISLRCARPLIIIQSLKWCHFLQTSPVLLWG